jgi:hypothetical protein
VWRGLRGVAGDRRVWCFGVVALLMGMLQQPFVAFVVAYATQVRGASTTVATVLAGSWIVGVVVAATRASRARRDARTRRLGASAGVIFAGAVCATVVPYTAALAVGIAACSFGISTLTLTLKSRLVELHPGRVGSAFALVSTIEFAGFAVPIAVGRVADTHGVHAGLTCFAAIASLLLLVSTVGDRTFARRPAAGRRSGGPDARPTSPGVRGPEVEAP